MRLTDPVAPRHVGSSQTRARTRVSCIGRQILNHCATREAQERGFYSVMGAIGSLDQGLGLDPKMSKVLSDGDGSGERHARQRNGMRKGAEVGKL